MGTLDLPAPATLAGTIAAALIAGTARGFSGFGAALIFVPLASMLLGPRLAAPLLLVVDFFTAMPLIPPAWRQASRREIGVMAAGTLVGTPAGALLLVNADPVSLRWAMSGLVLSLLALLASGWRYKGAPTASWSITVGAVSGFCSGAAQMGGPPVVAYWLGGSEQAARIRANIVLFFAVSSLISASIYFAGGLLDVRLVAISAMVAPAYGLGIWIGTRLFGLASESAFRRACFALIAAAAVISLPLWDGFRS